MVGKFALAAAVVGLLATTGLAQVYSDGFETYNLGALDKNLAGGPNAAPNGSGNPWFGPAPPNLQVVGAETAQNGTPVTPHSGTKMIRGTNVAGDGDQNWYNLAYRQNGGNPFTGNITMKWWFFDPVGAAAGAAAYQDYGALGFYNTAPGNTDYPGTGSLNAGVNGATIQRLSLGASSNQAAGFNSAVYQARDVGAADGYASGWFNTTIGRTVGWHSAEIDVGPALADNTNNLTYLIDGTTVLTHNSVGTSGYNVMEFNGNTSTTTAYFDDVSFSVNPVPEPSSLLLVAGGLAVAWRRRPRAAN